MAICHCLWWEAKVRSDAFRLLHHFFSISHLPFIHILLFQASELSDKRGNASPNSSASQIPQKSDGAMVSPVPSASSASTQRLPPGMMQHAMDQNSGNELNYFYSTILKFNLFYKTFFVVLP